MSANLNIDPAPGAVAGGGAARRAAAQLSIVVPTFNERDNVPELVRRVEAVLGDAGWEIIFVDDDSPDATAQAVRSLAKVDARVRCLHRIGRRGLSSACIEGVMSSSAPFVAVMDGDLQHDELLLPRMLQTLQADADAVDVVVGSRYASGGGIGSWAQSRAVISRLATRLSQGLVPVTLRDPMSGFFMFRREVFEERVRGLSGLGFKILVDLFATGKRPLRFVEMAYQFRQRHAGESKLDSQVAWDYLMLLLDKHFGRWVPVRFLAFAGIGTLGLCVHLVVLTALFKAGGLLPFDHAQASATLLAMTFNFSVNNLLTYRDRRLVGVRWWRGLASFMLVCSVGAVANIGIASYLFGLRGDWLPAAVAGVLVGAVWNYAVSSLYTWGKAHA